VQLGHLQITALSDGEAKLPPQYFHNADWGPHQALLGPDGFVTIPLGCFLIRDGERTVLVDAGIGPVSNQFFRGGDLPSQLEAAGVSPSDVDLLLCTHLHIDHIGWLVSDGAPFFPNATVRFGSQDIDQFVANAAPDDMTRLAIEALGPRVETIDADGEIAPGISTIHTPGHTLGHRSVILSAGDQRVFLLGDAITCPIQLTESDWEAISDVDAKAAKRSREALWRELEGSEDVAVASHFPGLEFNRVLAGEGKRYWS